MVWIKPDRRDLLCSALLLCALIFFCYVAVTAFPYKGYFDFAIFVGSALDFEKSGTLYIDDLGYDPNLAVYKFPPLMAAVLVHGARCGLVYEDFFTGAFWLHVFSYLGAILFIVAAGFSFFSVTRRMVVVLFSIGLLFCPLLDTNFIRLQLDVYVLFLVSVSLYCLSKNRNFLCGALIGLAAALKIYPALLVGCILVLGLWEAVAGVIVGFFLANLYSAVILGVDETMYFFTTVLPVLLQELPTGTGDGNISFPALFQKGIMSAYIMYDMHVFSDSEINQLIDAGKVDINAIMVLSDAVARFIKAATALLALGLMLVSFSIRKRAGPKCYAAIYSAFVFFNITFMPNAWLNYQVVLVAPILVVCLYLLAGDKSKRGILWVAASCLLALWSAATLDALQERANHYRPDDMQIVVTIGLSEAGRWVRSIAALLLLFVCLSLAVRQINQK